MRLVIAAQEMTFFLKSLNNNTNIVKPIFMIKTIKNGLNVLSMMVV